MPIVSSAYTIDAHTQSNGARWVVERHPSSDGRVIQHGPYLLPAGQGAAEAEAAMNARVASINARLADEEFAEVLNGA